MGMQLKDEQQSVFTDIGDVNFSDLDLAYHVRDSLKSVRTGECDSYHELIGVLHHTECLAPDEVAMLVTSLKALSGAVSYIDPDHHNLLLNSISGMSLWNYGVDVMDVLVELIVSLAAVNGKHLGLCLGMLVRNFVPPPSFLGLLKQPRGLAKKDQVLYRVHSALKDIADLVPLAPLILEGIIKEKMPYKNSNQPWILSVIYVESMLKLENGALGKLVGSSMLVEVVNRLVELDVDIEWVDLVADDSSKGIFEMEFEDQEMHGNHTAIVNEELPKGSFNQKFISGNEVAEHLDLLMLLTFEHLKSCYESGRLSQVCEILLQSFGKTVLRAYKSKFSQFVMFYACSLDPEGCGERFASWLADFFTNRAYAPEWRMGAVAYLASYLSRAKFIPASYIITMVESLVDWCNSYCKNQYDDINPRAHRVFYSGIQAVMYILCFRMSSMMGILRLKAQLFRLPVGAILKHSLNPLKVCLPSIVHEFMQQAKAARLFNVSDVSLFYDMLETELSRAFGGLERLDMFFPFDPYLLRNSDRYIRPNFIYWSMVRTNYADDDDDDDDDDEDDNSSEGSIDGDGVNTREEGIAMSFDDIDLSEFDNSLSKMSITPKNYRLGTELKCRMGMPSRIRPSRSPESM